MIRLKRLWFDLTHPKQWGIYIVISRFLWKLKDYDRLEHDYSCVLEYATNARMSKTNYKLNKIRDVIDEAQSEIYYEIEKDDIKEAIEYIMGYINGLGMRSSGV